MRRRIVLLLATIAVGLGVPAAQPATAHTDACAGWGLANVSAPHGYLATGAPSTTSDIVIGLSSGACAASFSPSFFVTVSGWCETTVGSGVTNTGHAFNVTGSGYNFVFTGGVTGTISLYTHYGPCIPFFGSFWATGQVAFTH